MLSALFIRAPMVVLPCARGSVVQLPRQDVVHSSALLKKRGTQ